MAVSRDELRYLLQQADRVLEIVPSARALLDAAPATVRGVLTIADEDGSAHLIIPGATVFPPSLYATSELDGLPGARERLGEFLARAGTVAMVRSRARDAAPGFLGRIFGGAKVEQAQRAAEELRGRLVDPGMDALFSDARGYVELAHAASALQQRGVHLFAGPHGTPDRLIDAAREAVEQAVGSSLVFETYDPTRLHQVLAAARRLRDDPHSEPALRLAAERQLDALTAERAGVLLAQLPVEALKTATNERLRFSGLDQVRVNTVADVLAAPVGLLTQVQGIGEQTARRLKAAAEALRQEAVATHTHGIGDTPTAAATALVRVLASFDHINTLDEVERARRRRILGYAETIPAVGGVEPWAVGLSGSRVGWDRFIDDIDWAHAHPAVLAPARPVTLGEDTWSDYLARPAHYQGLLATLLDLEVEGGDDLAADVLERIRALRLDQTHLTDLHLRGYQSFGARFTIVQEKVILGDEMGLGKTVQALAVAAHLGGRTLVVCPASVVTNWVRESRRFTDLPVYKAHGDGKEDAVRAWEDTGGICVVTYDGARTMDLPTPEFVVVDEAHMIKNPAAARTRACRALIDAASHALLMTGTPLENRVAEFATLVSYVAPDLLVAGMESMSAEDFRVRVAPAYLRRNQADVLDELPEKLDQLDWIDLTEADQAHYAEAVEAANFMAMRRAPMTTPDAVPAKLERILEIVEEAAESDRRVLVFTYFLDVLGVLERALGDRVVGTVSGAVSPNQRQELIDALGKAPGGSVLLAQITAGGTGLNIQTASVVILVEPQVKPSIEAQAIARVHRMGQTSTVLVHRLVADDTVDERMLEMLAGKSAIFDAYARPSESASVHDAVDVTERQLAAEIIAAERERLGFAAS